MEPKLRKVIPYAEWIRKTALLKVEDGYFGDTGVSTMDEAEKITAVYVVSFSKVMSDIDKAKKEAYFIIEASKGKQYAWVKTCKI